MRKKTSETMSSLQVYCLSCVCMCVCGCVCELLDVTVIQSGRV